MDKNDALKIAKKYVNAVGERYSVSQAYLFGSYAKGNNRADSDIDVAIVLNTVDNTFDTQIAIMKMRTNEELMIEPHIFRTSEYVSFNPLAYEVMKYGAKIV
ncbi:hypothetical protein FACS1894178_1810 [Bacteroidia bacterium]|nr:hypothetical protein FACS1894178_1810 [Bacteroidia bacterium]